jgi:hypothetical protein
MIQLRYIKVLLLIYPFIGDRVGAMLFFKPMQKYKKGVMILCEFDCGWLNSVKCCFWVMDCWFRWIFQHVLLHKFGPNETICHETDDPNLIQILDPNGRNHGFCI